jgi:hypothetical protein
MHFHDQHPPPHARISIANEVAIISVIGARLPREIRAEHRDASCRSDEEHEGSTGRSFLHPLAERDDQR